MSADMSRIAQVLALWTVCAILWFWLLVGDQRQELAQAHQRLQDASLARESARALADLRRRFVPANQTMDWVSAMVPFITKSAAGNGVTIGDLSPRAVETRGPAKALPMDLTLAGSYGAIARFVEDLERGNLSIGTIGSGSKSSLILRVSTLDLTARPPGTDHLEGSARIELYSL